MRPRRSIGPVIVRAGIFLLLGVVMTYASAWGCSLRAAVVRVGWRGGLHGTAAALPSAEARAEWDAVFGPSVYVATREETRFLDPQTVPRSETLGWLMFMLREERAATFGMRWLSLGDELRSVPPSVIVVRAGWPMPAVRSRVISQGGFGGAMVTRAEGGFVLRRSLGGGPGSRRIELPYRPIWPGLAVNTIFYGASAWVIVAGLRERRCRVRVRRGLCPACAYPVGLGPMCTECGQPVVPRIGGGG